MALRNLLGKGGGVAAVLTGVGVQDDLSLTGNTSLAATDPVAQFVTPDADGWKVTLPANPIIGYFVLINVDATYSFDVYQSDGTTKICTLAPLGSSQFTYQDSSGTYYR